MRRNTIQDFWLHVDSSGGRDACWLWTGGTFQKSGYGRFSWRGRMVLSHRFAWESVIGAVPDGRILCHTCDNRICVNTSHLYVGSYKDNIRDCIVRGRRNSSKGAEHPNAKITESAVREIRRKYADGRTQRELSAEYGVEQTNISRIVRRVMWRHVS